MAAGGGDQCITCRQSRRSRRSNWRVRAMGRDMGGGDAHGCGLIIEEPQIEGDFCRFFWGGLNRREQRERGEGLNRRKQRGKEGRLDRRAQRSRRGPTRNSMSLTGGEVLKALLSDSYVLWYRVLR